MTKKTAKEQQVGGDHYKKYKIQPLEFMIANNIPYAEASAMIYLLRWKDKGGVEDLKKAKHTIDFLIEGEEKEVDEVHEAMDYLDNNPGSKLHQLAEHWVQKELAKHDALIADREEADACECGIITDEDKEFCCSSHRSSGCMRSPGCYDVYDVNVSFDNEGSD